MSKFFCPAPWKSIYFHIDKTAVCCITSKRFKMSPSEFLKSDYLAELKETMLRGDIHETCLPCKKLEDSGLQSIRLHQLYKHGVDTTENLNYMELRTSNLCNFECIMCNAGSSSLIAKKIYTVTDKNWVEIKKMSENLKWLTLTGGEPMLMKHYYELLDHLISLEKTNMEISVYTNASVYNPIFIEKLLKFDTKRLHLSIDGVEDSAEKQRKGTNWKIVSKNIEKFIKLPVGIIFHSTFTKITLLDLLSLAKYFVDVLSTNPKCNYVAHTVISPKDLSIFNSSEHEKTLMLQNINDSLKILTNPAFDQFNQQLRSYQSILQNG